MVLMQKESDVWNAKAVLMDADVRRQKNKTRAEGVIRCLKYWAMEKRVRDRL